MLAHGVSGGFEAGPDQKPQRGDTPFFARHRQATVLSSICSQGRALECLATLFRVDRRTHGQHTCVDCPGVATVGASQVFVPAIDDRLLKPLTMPMNPS